MPTFTETFAVIDCIVPVDFPSLIRIIKLPGQPMKLIIPDGYGIEDALTITADAVEISDPVAVHDLFEATVGAAEMKLFINTASFAALAFYCQAVWVSGKALGAFAAVGAVIALVTGAAYA